MANNSYDIFQLKNDDSTRELRFEGLRRLAKMGAKVQRENYDLIYNAPLGEKDTLDSIYEKFNLYHPEDFRGHSLSVSDIVVFHKDGVDTAYYVDSFGFAEVPEFLLVQAMEKATPKESERFHQIIQKEVGRMSRLIGDMLAVANADSRSWNMLFAPCELDTLLLDTYEKYEPLMQEKGLSLNVSLPDDALPPCTCDASRISQTLGILLDNAISYVPPKGRVELTLSFDTRHFYLSVSDNGPGIADEKKEAVFQRFYRGDSSRTDKEHFGLGLSIASEILRFHKGSLKVTDTPGGGSTFLLSLPR